MSPFNLGIPIIVSPLCLKDTPERHFPASRHRSARIHKKLIKRHGGEFVQVPAAYKTPMGIIAHPAIAREIEKRLTSMA